MRLTYTSRGFKRINNLVPAQGFNLMQAYNTIFTNNIGEYLLFNLKISTSTKYHFCTGFV